MERVQVVAFAVLLSALALFGASLIADRHGQPAAQRGTAAGALDDGERTVRLWGSERESRRGPRAGEPGGPPAEPRRVRRGGGDAPELDADGNLVVPGARRMVRVGGTGDADEVGADGLAGDRLAARAGTLPRAGAAGPAEPPRQEVQADPDPQPERRNEAGGVLLSIPLQGSLVPDQGGAPTQADGVTVDRDAADFTEDAQYTLPAGGHVDGAMGTISFDVEPHWAGSDESNNSLLQIREEHQWENALAIVKNYDALRFIIIDAAGVETNVNVPIGEWQAGEAHRITASWGENQMTLYVDGAQVGQATLPHDLAFGDATPIHIGSDFPGSQYRGANGRISNLTIYGRTLGQGEID